MLVLLLSLVVSIPLLAFLLIYFHKWNRDSGPVISPDLTGKTILITGASAGIGKEAARDLASRGARILMACRNIAKTQKVVDEISTETGNSNIEIYQLELSNLESVRKCAQRILEKEKRLDVLINNAGIGSHEDYILTADGLEFIMATNYYGHFLLTNLLLGLLKKSSPSRILNLSSSFHIFSPNFDVNSMNKKMTFMNDLRMYGQSKMCMILFSVELARRLNGTGVTANSIDPGFVRTEIFEKPTVKSTNVFGKFIAPVSLSAKEGSRTMVYLAASQDVEGLSGRYFLESRIFWEFPLGRDFRQAQRLWKASERDVKLDYHKNCLKMAD